MMDEPPLSMKEFDKGLQTGPVSRDFAKLFFSRENDSVSSVSGIEIGLPIKSLRGHAVILGEM